MLGNMLAYPFVLAGRKPATVLGAYLAFVLFMMALDVAFAAMGQDMLSASSDPFGQDRAVYQVYNLLSGLFGLGVAALVMGAALIALKRRPETEPPAAGDGVRFFALNIKFGVMVVLPFVIVGGLAFGAAFQVNMWAAVAVTVPVVLGFIYVGIRLYLAWARALATGDAHLLRAWPLTKDKVWVTLGLFVAAHAVALTPLIGAALLAEIIGLTPYGPIDSLSAALAPGVLAYSAVYNAAVAFSTVYVAITPAFMLDALDPIKPNVADVF